MSARLLAAVSPARRSAVRRWRRTLRRRGGLVALGAASRVRRRLRVVRTTALRLGLIVAVPRARVFRLLHVSLLADGRCTLHRGL